jgi:hypothetical protein
MMFRAPPTAACAFKRNAQLATFSTSEEVQRIEPLKVFAVIRHRRFIQPVEKRARFGWRDLSGATANHARNGARIAPFLQSNQQFGKCLIAFSNDGIVNELHRAHPFAPHFSLEVRAAKQYDQLRVALFQPPRQRK